MESSRRSTRRPAPSPAATGDRRRPPRHSGTIPSPPPQPRRRDSAGHRHQRAAGSVRQPHRLRNHASPYRAIRAMCASVSTFSTSVGRPDDAALERPRRHRSGRMVPPSSQCTSAVSSPPDIPRRPLVDARLDPVEAGRDGARPRARSTSARRRRGRAAPPPSPRRRPPRPRPEPRRPAPGAGATASRYRSLALAGSPSIPFTTTIGRAAAAAHGIELAGGGEARAAAAQQSRPLDGGRTAGRRSVRRGARDRRSESRWSARCMRPGCARYAGQQPRHPGRSRGGRARR